MKSELGSSYNSAWQPLPVPRFLWHITSADALVPPIWFVSITWKMWSHWDISGTSVYCSFLFVSLGFLHSERLTRTIKYGCFHNRVSCLPGLSYQDTYTCQGKQFLSCCCSTCSIGYLFGDRLPYQFSLTEGN